mmetsp:Transcript_54869/g.151924  ORF Transcript_54869/g.151924 Transcript_54869/m.151924 type:complete len:288 (-) Transcript_54869:102-965(-)
MEGEEAGVSYGVSEWEHGGRYLIATRPVSKHERILSVPVAPTVLKTQPDTWTVQLESGKHLDFATSLPSSELLNHSCQPNCALEFAIHRGLSAGCTSAAARAAHSGDAEATHGGEAAATEEGAADTASLAAAVEMATESATDTDMGLAWSGMVNLVALRSIAPREALTFDYHTTEWDMASPFTCLCLAPGCVGTVRGYKWLTAEQREAVEPHLSPFVRELAAEAKRGGDAAAERRAMRAVAAPAPAAATARAVGAPPVTACAHADVVPERSGSDAAAAAAAPATASS